MPDRLTPARRSSLLSIASRDAELNAVDYATLRADTCLALADLTAKDVLIEELVMALRAFEYAAYEHPFNPIGHLWEHNEPGRLAREALAKTEPDHPDPSDEAEVKSDD